MLPSWGRTKRYDGYGIVCKNPAKAFTKTDYETHKENMQKQLPLPLLILLLNTKIPKKVQWKPLNVITLGQRESDNIIRMLTIINSSFGIK
jgi:hypothetical protein